MECVPCLCSFSFFLFFFFLFANRQLLKNPKVLFAGYKVPHPLEHNFVLKIQTTPDTTPMEVFSGELNNLINEISTIKLKFEVITYLISFSFLFGLIRCSLFQNQLTLFNIDGGGNKYNASGIAHDF